MNDSLEQIKPDLTVDARGTSCPGPLLEAKKGITKVKVGGILEVLSSDESTIKNLQTWCKKIGHEFLGYKEESGYYRIFVRRKK